MKKFKKILVTVFIILTVTCLSVLPVLAAQVEGGQVGGSSTGSNPNITFYSWTKDQLQIGFTRDNDLSFTLYSPVSNNTVSREAGYTMIKNNQHLSTTYSDIERFNNIAISTPTSAVTKDTVYHGIGPQYIGQTATFRMVLDVSFAGYEIDPEAKVTLWPQFSAYFYTNPNNLNEKFEILDRETSYESYYGSDFQIVIDYSFEITRSLQICGFFFNVPMSIFINDKEASDKLLVDLNFRISDIVLDKEFYDVQGGVENAINSTIGRPGDPNYKEYNNISFESENDIVASFVNNVQDSDINFKSLTDILVYKNFVSSAEGFGSLLLYLYNIDFIRIMIHVSVTLGCFAFLLGIGVSSFNLLNGNFSSWRSYRASGKYSLKTESLSSGNSSEVKYLE